MEKPDEAVQSWRNHVAYGVGILFSLFHCWNAYAGTFPGQQLTTIHLTGTLIIGFLLKPAWQGRRALEAAFSAVLAALALITGVYLFHAYNTYSSRAGMPTTLDVVLGWVLILIVLEGARRCLGNGLVVLAAVFLVYMGVGPYLPDVLSHRGFSLTEIAEVMFLSTDGIHGTPLQISAKFVVMFIIFGALLQNSGGGQFILDLAASLFGRVRGGPAKVAVLASSLFGTISGSAPANVMAVGWLTIPLMKRMGATSVYAAAVEAVASTGGQIMPPVMGAAAFLMADFLSMSYAKICIAAAIPAVLYYVALYFLLDFEAIKQRWTKEAIQATITDSQVRLSWTGVLHLVPVAVLIYFMFVAANTAFISALWACISVVLIAQLFPQHRGVKNVVKSLAAGGRGSVEVALACAAAGIVLGALTQTGLGIQMSSLLASLSGGNLYVLLVLTAISSLILGMGMPTTPCYIIVAVTIVPAIVKLGVLPLAAHMFVFYFGCISGITPPVAVAAYAAAGIARSDPFRSGWLAFRMGMSGFILPFMFVTGPALLMIGDTGTIVWSCLTATIGVAGLSATIVGHVAAPLRAWERIVLGLGAILLIDTGLMTDIIGIVVFGVIAVRQYVAWRGVRANALSVAAAK